MKAMRTMAGMLVVTLVAGGCSGSNGIGDLFSSGRSSSAASSAVYAAVDGLPVLDKPAGSARTVGRLALNQKVSRSKVDNGFARVKAGSLQGWVVNSKLSRTRIALSAKPAGSASAVAPAAPSTGSTTAETAGAATASGDAATAEAANAEAASASAAGADAAIDAAVEPQTSAPDAAPAHEPKPAPRNPPSKPRVGGASVFDPY
ncbi:MAG TPA: hypothetical protein VN634_11105 [Candidatus Limnocylindrales bacterium]|nr:hypothetical protein [Candidatus Limnocylindrales bacterium]